MLSATALSTTFKSDQSGWPDPLWRGLRRFLRRLLSPAGLRMPDLPAELRGDIGLPEALPESRDEQFWDEKQSSGARDLPL